MNTDMSSELLDRYLLWRRANPEAVLNLSEHEQFLFKLFSQEDYNFILQLKLFIVEATEHIAEQLIPIYSDIIKASSVEQLLQYTTHERQVVRFAATQKIDLLEGRELRRETVVLFPNRWPNQAWNTPRKRNKRGHGLTW